MFFSYNRKLLINARTLRNNMTEEEKKLWYQYLSRYPVRFIRQKVIDNYILDFYCATCKLCIEIDGGQHYTETGIGHDAARTAYLNACGISVLRFTNQQVKEDFHAVCMQIDRAVHEGFELQPR